jgi:DNA polymerase-3 subunit delta'
MISTPERRTNPPWLDLQLAQLLSQRGHAWLLNGAGDLGQLDLAFSLARAWLCDRAPAGKFACGACASCHAIDVASHADLCLLMPETQMMQIGWPISEKAQTEIDEKKRKASREIRVEAMRDAVEFSQRTSARGKGKVVLIFPAENMNNIAANTLLKTLEEPAGDVKFVLATEAVHHILPTIRSRCQGHTMAWPKKEDSLSWLEQNGIALGLAQSLFRATGGKPAEAASLALEQWDPSKWDLFGRAMAHGDLACVQNLPAPQLIEMLQKLCHDLICHAVGAQPRYFTANDLEPFSPSLQHLTDWAQSLAVATKTVDHPFNAGLFQESLVARAKSALNSVV